MNSRLKLLWWVCVAKTIAELYMIVYLVQWREYEKIHRDWDHIGRQEQLTTILDHLMPIFEDWNILLKIKKIYSCSFGTNFVKFAQCGEMRNLSIKYGNFKRVFHINLFSFFTLNKTFFFRFICTFLLYDCFLFQKNPSISFSFEFYCDVLRIYKDG